MKKKRHKQPIAPASEAARRAALVEELAARGLVPPPTTSTAAAATPAVAYQLGNLRRTRKAPPALPQSHRPPRRRLRLPPLQGPAGTPSPPQHHHHQQHQPNRTSPASVGHGPRAAARFAAPPRAAALAARPSGRETQSGIPAHSVAKAPAQATVHEPSARPLPAPRAARYGGKPRPGAAAPSTAKAPVPAAVFASSSRPLPAPRASSITPGGLVPCPTWDLRDFAVGPVIGRSRNPVYLARHVQSGARVALKCISRQSLRAPADARLMCRELTVHAALSAHADVIVRLYGFFWDNEHIYLVLEHADGGDLQAALAASPGGRVDERRAARLISSVARALHYCHSAGIAHRDVKPGNILLHGATRHAKLTDFGLSDFVCATGQTYTPATKDFARPRAARQSHPSQVPHAARSAGRQSTVVDQQGFPPGFGNDLAHVVSLQQRHNRPPLKRAAAKSQLHEWVGTHDYMSPQILAHRAAAGRQSTASEAYDERCDLWALGCLLYECVVGKPPFFHEDLEETYRRIENCDLRFPATPSLSPECRLLIRKLLHKDPTKRPSAFDVLRSSWIQRNLGNQHSTPRST